MRAPALPLVVLALLALAATAPAAQAAALALPAGRTYEAALAPGGEADFTVPIEIGEEGGLYAKLLPTPGNAVTDGAKDNGSVADGTGWRVAFTLLREGQEPLELGAYASGDATPVVPVRPGETPTLRAKVHAPSDALLGGPVQRVYVAVALRVGAQEPGATSGASQDAARAVTLVAHLAGTRPPPGGELPGVGPIDTGTGGANPPETDQGSTDPPTAPPAVPPAAASLPVPFWWLVLTASLLALIAVGVALIAYAQMPKLRRAAGVRVPVREPAPPVAAPSAKAENREPR